MAETEANPELEQAILIAKRFPRNIGRPRYNYVNLNDDGAEKILAVAMGPYTNGCGGGVETEFMLLTCSDGFYTQVNDGGVLEPLDGVEGTAIICNDLIADIEPGNYLTLVQG